MKTLFEKIIDGELPSEKVFENEKVIAIKDIAPQAPIHILIIPKKVIRDLQNLQPEDFSLMGEVVRVAQEIARKYKLAESGYRLVINNGRDAGQTVPHLHVHLMGGTLLPRMG